MTYMMPLTTIGDVSIESTTSVWKIQAGRRFLTLPTLIWRDG